MAAVAAPTNSVVQSQPELIFIYLFIYLFFHYFLVRYEA